MQTRDRPHEEWFQFYEHYESGLKTSDQLMKSLLQLFHSQSQWATDEILDHHSPEAADPRTEQVTSTNNTSNIGSLSWRSFWAHVVTSFKRACMTPFYNQRDIQSDVTCKGEKNNRFWGNKSEWSHDSLTFQGRRSMRHPQIPSDKDGQNDTKVTTCDTCMENAINCICAFLMKQTVTVSMPLKMLMTVALSVWKKCLKVHK